MAPALVAEPDDGDSDSIGRAAGAERATYEGKCDTAADGSVAEKTTAGWVKAGRVHGETGKWSASVRSG
jgi:hypothetical protein